MRVFLASLALVLAAACVPATAPVQQAPPTARSGEVAVQQFAAVVSRVMPIARQRCQQQNRGERCDFFVAVDDTPGVEPNAFQTVMPNGQPVVGFTLPMILLTRNTDEIAFILAHEAAHHIAGHITRERASASIGAALVGELVAARGGTAEAIRRAQGIGAVIGARRYAKQFEHEADILGAFIAQEAGYDPLTGIRFFERAPDAGDQFLGTHPPNADRIRLVRRALAGS